jgi:hypothetical protein
MDCAGMTLHYVFIPVPIALESRHGVQMGWRRRKLLCLRLFYTPLIHQSISRFAIELKSVLRLGASNFGTPKHREKHTGNNLGCNIFRHGARQGGFWIIGRAVSL